MTRDEARETIARYVIGHAVQPEILQDAWEELKHDPEYAHFLAEELGPAGPGSEMCTLFRENAAEYADSPAETREREFPEFLGHLLLCPTCRDLYNHLCGVTEFDSLQSETATILRFEEEALRLRGIRLRSITRPVRAAVAGAVPQFAEAQRLPTEPMRARREWILEQDTSPYVIYVVAALENSRETRIDYHVKVNPGLPDSERPKGMAEVRAETTVSRVEPNLPEDIVKNDYLPPSLQDSFCASPGHWRINLNVSAEGQFWNWTFSFVVNAGAVHVKGHMYTTGEFRRALQCEPEFWPLEVSRRLRPIMQKLAAWQTLEQEECATLAQFFVYPNLVHWILHMRQTDQARACEWDCPLDEVGDACGDAMLRVPRQLYSFADDFCPQRAGIHPWALQVSLLWNSVPSRAGVRLEPALYPSRECTWQIYERVVNNATNKARWTRVRALRRSAEHRRRWDQLMEGVERALNTIHAEQGQATGSAVAECIDPSLVVQVCLDSKSVIEQWIRVQRAWPAERQTHFDLAVRAFVVQLLLTLKRGWPFPPGRHASEVKDLLSVVRFHGISVRDELEVMLRKDSLDMQQQRVLFDLLREAWRSYQADLPPGDPLEDILIQDLFWHRVAGSPSATENFVFDLDKWSRERWSPSDYNPELPRWMY